MSQVTRRNAYRYEITKNIELVTYDELKLTKRTKKLPLVTFEKNRPMVILLTWLNAKRKHAKKFVDLYLIKGFDVLTISTNVWQVMWPTTGSQVIASDILEFLKEHDGFRPLFVHGFSCGTYLWSEVWVKVEADMENYLPIMKKVKGQVFDSPPSTPPQFQRGFARALFPNNSLLCFLFEYAVTLQLYLFYDIVTKHIIKGYEAAHNPPVNTPSLMFISKDDPIAPFDRNMNIVKTWKSKGIEAHVKWWERSPHVGHFVRHQEEYLEHLNSLLDSVGLNDLKSENEIEATTCDSKRKQVYVK